MLKQLLSISPRRNGSFILILIMLIASAAQAGLPTAFDWRVHFTLPPVRNQQQCGSCWAISAVDIVEVAILIRLGETVDLSEQWLVSCTQGGNGCNGGVLAYALDSMKCSGSTHADPCGGTGAVLEADFPYTASNAPCQCPYKHQYCVDSWSYVTGSNPTSSQLKQAIWDYGPIACHMDVYADIYDYTSGIYTHVSGAYQGIKSMVIVGWGYDMGQEYWIVRNSWGASWADNGYFKVAFGTCNIGSYAVYVGGVSKIEIGHYCGEPGQVYLSMDFDKDCYVGLSDLALFAAEWLKCTDLSNPACSWE